MARNEVDLHRAEKGQTALFIVPGIRLTVEIDEKVAGIGKLQIFIGWDIDE